MLIRRGMYTGTPGRLAHFSYLGVHRYLLTFCTFDRRELFTTDERVTVVRTQILRAACDESMAIIADCYMPDHLHLLVEGQEPTSDCRRFIARAKQLSGFYFHRQFRERVWQRYGHERVLRSAEATLSAVRYVFENPVRAGLVARVTDYPFTGSSLYTVEQIVEAIQLKPWKSG